MSSNTIQKLGLNTEYKLPQTFGLNVGGVNRQQATDIGKTQYVESEAGDRIAYTDKRGFTGLMGDTSGINQAGYKHTRPMREVCVA